MPVNDSIRTPCRPEMQLQRELRFSDLEPESNHISCTPRKPGRGLIPQPSYLFPVGIVSDIPNHGKMSFFNNSDQFAQNVRFLFEDDVPVWHKFFSPQFEERHHQLLTACHNIFSEGSKLRHVRSEYAGD
jgi:hypothetical protein